MRLSFIELAALSALALPSALGAQERKDKRALDDTLVLHYVGHAIGRETYTLAPSDSGWTLVSDFDYRDRGRRIHVTGAMRLARNFAPVQLEIARLSDTSRTIDTRVDVRGTAAIVIAHNETTHVALPARAFAIAGTAPVTQHLALVRWRMGGPRGSP